ncbi:MAG: type I-E CRISPR-associated protein Cas7/Cse4/CasC [Spirochaetales bacterium]|uniref:Type I-E CRISPR-associated protein Cas7/Cse4/CasC n=1 Tax=Candidatus Thalassospirochaeta sargassi TaxID=3119039 RepID=A0AAJ1IHZ6_9SPIO|nr:type I-E CRISPR-associated protein Cas7/Cse4/CasC [Spirochaetales bacterium]
MEKNFVNYHVLISHNPSCLNRDDMNMQKTAVFGGTKRIRISSQSLKRTMRKSDYYKENISDSSIRSRLLFHPEEPNLKDLFVENLKDRFHEDIIIKALEVLSGKKYDAAVEIMADSVAPWAIEEVAWFCEKIEQSGSSFDDKKFIKEVKQDIAALRENLKQSVDIALSGRMATSGLMTELGKVDGALAVAHAITTHTVENDLDWFTAVDDLQELGSGHLDTQEFSSGVFYRYASLNLGQLRDNLGNASREEVLRIAAHVLHLLATETPSAKQQSFAAFNLADFAMVSFSDMPISLANAFESPVPKNEKGFLKPSIEKLQEYWSKIHSGYALDEKTTIFTISDFNIVEGLSKKNNLADVERWIVSDGE